MDSSDMKDFIKEVVSVINQTIKDGFEKQLQLFEAEILYLHIKSDKNRNEIERLCAENYELKKELELMNRRREESDYGDDQATQSLLKRDTILNNVQHRNMEEDKKDMSFEWGYTNENGPHTWAKHFPCASGSRQSPIIINSSVAKQDSELTANPLTPDLNHETAARVTNTGAGFRVDCESEQLQLSGGPLAAGDVYRMAQFHFHWGAKNDWGSEHLLDGHAFASEMHMVFWNTSQFPSVGDAASAPNGLAVLGSFITAGSENAAIEPVVRALEEVRDKGSAAPVPEPITISDLLPDDTTHYFTYKGSLTTPPCNESVTWIVFKDPISLSVKQLEAFRSLRVGADGSENIVDNFRPPAPLGDRQLNSSF